MIDLYQIHRPIPDEDIERAGRRSWTSRRKGCIRHIGVSNFTVEQLERIGAIAPVETLQPPYSLLARQIEDTTLPYCREHRIGVIAYSPMASGLLTGSMTADASRNFRQTTGEAGMPASASRSSEAISSWLRASARSDNAMACRPALSRSHG